MNNNLFNLNAKNEFFLKHFKYICLMLGQLIFTAGTMHNVSTHADIHVLMYCITI